MRSLGLIALLALAILAVITALAMNHPARVEPAPAGSVPEPVAAAPVATDAGSLDSILNAVPVEHAIKHGR